jgi:hypothetical protein
MKRLLNPFELYLLASTATVIVLTTNEHLSARELLLTKE